MSEDWRQRRFAPPSGTPLCTVAEIADGGAREFVYGEGKDAFRLTLLRDGDVAYAYVNSCPHFGIPLNSPDFVTTQRRVICVSHYARFRFRDGYCEDGPCQGASLEPIPLALDEGAIRIR